MSAPKTPKGAKSAYVFFCSQERPNVLASNPKLEFTEVGRILGQRWKDADAATKKKYQEMAEADKLRFQSEVQNFKASGGNEQDLKKKRKSNKNDTADQEATSQKKSRKKTPSDGPTVKRPMTAFFYFSKDYRKEYDGKGLSVGQVGKELGNRWKSADDTVKAKYQEMANADKQRYLNEKSSLSASKAN